MRPGQQNKRMRGRGRRGPNPLSRSYESNGPDVKIRGTAAHIAEKYMQLARDAHASGDPVAAESYLQHAEHYFRIIAAAQQAQAQQPGAGGDHQQPRQRYNGADRYASEEEDSEDSSEQETQHRPAPQQQPASEPQQQAVPQPAQTASEPQSADPAPAAPPARRRRRRTAEASEQPGPSGNGANGAGHPDSREQADDAPEPAPRRQRVETAGADADDVKV